MYVDGFDWLEWNAWNGIHRFYYGRFAAKYWRIHAWGIGGILGDADETSGSE
jgi:hypothetical protein